MKKLIAIPALLVLITGCGTVGETFPMPSTMKCLKQAEGWYIDEGSTGTWAVKARRLRQQRINECMWAKAGGKKD